MAWPHCGRARARGRPAPLRSRSGHPHRARARRATRCGDRPATGSWAQSCDPSAGVGTVTSDGGAAGGARVTTRKRRSSSHSAGWARSSDEHAAAEPRAQVERREPHVGGPQLRGAAGRVVQVEDEQPGRLERPDDEVVVLGDRQPGQRSASVPAAGSPTRARPKPPRLGRVGRSVRLQVPERRGRAASRGLHADRVPSRRSSRGCRTGRAAPAPIRRAWASVAACAREAEWQGSRAQLAAGTRRTSLRCGATTRCARASRPRPAAGGSGCRWRPSARPPESRVPARLPVRSAPRALAAQRVRGRRQRVADDGADARQLEPVDRDAVDRVAGAGGQAAPRARAARPGTRLATAAQLEPMHGLAERPARRGVRRRSTGLDRRLVEPRRHVRVDGREEASERGTPRRGRRRRCARLDLDRRPRPRGRRSSARAGRPRWSRAAAGRGGGRSRRGRAGRARALPGARVARAARPAPSPPRASASAV